jgi:hypothetical protein
LAGLQLLLPVALKAMSLLLTRQLNHVIAWFAQELEVAVVVRLERMDLTLQVQVEKAAVLSLSVQVENVGG